MQIGIRLHDVNTECEASLQTLETRCAKAVEEGFRCVHLALAKVIPGVSFSPAALTEGLAMHTRRVLSNAGLDTAVLGCYLNLANPDRKALEQIKKTYYANIRTAALLGAGVVGTETGTPNREYKPDRASRSDEALLYFMHSLEDVLRCASDYGVSVAIEPVWTHIVYSPKRAAEVLRQMQCSNLRIIFDPVNLLGIENAASREDIFREAVDLLGEDIAVVHLKDFRRDGGQLVSCAAGTGEMDYLFLLRYLKQEKPYIQATLEETCNSNAVFSREYIQKLYLEA